MLPSDFSDRKSGRAVRTPQGYWAFAPDPLPPRIEISMSTARALSEADRGLGELAGCARNLPNPHLLIGPFIKREAVLSSRIEGTQASLSDLFLFEAREGARATLPPDTVEVANYVAALEHGLERLQSLPLSLRLIREIHARLLTGVRGAMHTPGEFRTSQNWIGRAGCDLAEAVYVPPAVDDMKAALADFEGYLHAPTDLPPLVRQAIIHYQFEAIHPFLDGNGRIGRLLIIFLMCCDELLPHPLLYLSAFFEQRRQQYYDSLLRISQRGEWIPWIEFFLRGVATQARDALWRADRLLALRQSYRERMQTARSSALLLQMVDDLFALPMVSVPTVARKLKITQRAVRMNVRKLVDAGILAEITGRERYRMFVASEILEAIQMEKPRALE